MDNDKVLGEIQQLRDRARMVREVATYADTNTQMRQEYAWADELDAEANELESSLRSVL